MAASLIATVAISSAAGAASFVVSVENAGVQNTTSTFSYKGVESFDARTTTGLNATTNQRTGFGVSNNNLIGNYTGVSFVDADDYGGAGGAGKYAVAWGGDNGNVSYSLDLTTKYAQGINYFGYWLSAADAGNVVSFYKAGSLAYTFSTADLLKAVGPSYFGNPNSGADGSEAFAFVNFYDTNDTFDRIVFTQTNANSGYESDNHTVGRYATTSGTTISAVPEPATWMAMICGFGMVGALIRKDTARRGLARL